jgi:RNase adapter protein RapZ
MMLEGRREHPGSVVIGTRVYVLSMPGMARAERSTAPKTLDDLGYDAFDCLSLSLVPALLESAAAAALPAAVVGGARTRGLPIESVLEIRDDMVERTSHQPMAISVACDDERREPRYTETRPPHPLAGDGPALDGIRLEWRAASPLRSRADHVVDIANLSAVGLKPLLPCSLALEGVGLRVSAISLGHSQSARRDADQICDLLYLDNPPNVSDLQPVTGRDPRIATYIESESGSQLLLMGPRQLLQSLPPGYGGDGQTDLTIGIGCTGGRHRAAYVGECLTGELRIAGMELAQRDICSASPEPLAVITSAVAS